MGSPVVSSVPDSQTWLGLLAAEPIKTELSAGIGLGEVVHDEPFQLASSTAPSSPAVIPASVHHRETRVMKILSSG